MLRRWAPGPGLAKMDTILILQTPRFVNSGDIFDLSESQFLNTNVRAVV